MNLIEALREANGKPIARKSWPDKQVFYQVVKGILTLSGKVSDECFRLFECHFLATDWYVVEPTNPIEAEIEKEWSISECPTVNKRIRPLINFALEQAIMVCRDKLSDINVMKIDIPTAIRALKVKE